MPGGRRWRLALLLGAVSLLALACGDDRGEAQVDAGAVGAVGPTGGRMLGAQPLVLQEVLQHATDFDFIPGTSQLLVLLKSGRLLHYELQGETLTQLGEVLVEVHDEEDCGLISLAFDPDFLDNGLLYLSLCTSAQESGVFRYVFDPADHAATRASGAPIVVQAEPRAQMPWHNVGAMDFDSEGNLWVGFGDKTVSVNATDPGTALGGVLRIQPDRAANGQGHRVPADNPLVGVGTQDAGGVEDALYAWGLRSPWRLAVDDRDRVWIGDVGLDDREELNVIDGPGLDFGWPAAEGPCVRGCSGLRQPLLSWTHDSEHPYVLDDPEAAATTLRVVWVGGQYAPRRTDRYDGLLEGGMLFGDSCLGNLRIAEVDVTGVLVRDAHLGHLGRGTMALRLGPDDYLYGLTMGSCVTNGDRAPSAGFFRLQLQ